MYGGHCCRGVQGRPCKQRSAAPDPPLNLRAYPGPTISPRASLSWSPPADSTGITGYRVWWKKNGVAGLDSVDADALSRSVELVVEEQIPYTFMVATRRDNLLSTAATIQWGGRFPLAPAADLVVSFSSATVADLHWTPSTDASVSGYRVTWQDLDSTTVTGTMIAGRATNAISLPGIDMDRNYLFALYARDGERVSTPILAEWRGKLTPPNPPEKLEMSSLSASSVALRWTASHDTGMITYRVSWREANAVGGDSATIDAATNSAVASGLVAGRAYRFSVVALRGGKASSPIGGIWSGAEHYTDDQGNAIRIYETASANGAGLTLDPSKGGPKTVGVGSSNPNPGDVQLAIFTSSQEPNSFEMGPAYAFTEYKNADDFDPNTFVSEYSYLAESLGSWYLPEGTSVDRIIPLNGNIRAFTFQVVQSGTSGQGFYVRTGTPGNYHYARVFIRNSGGRLLQGTAPNRYVELEISYQLTPNLPFAKRANQGEAPGNVRSHVRR